MKRIVIVGVLAVVSAIAAGQVAWGEGHCAPLPGDRPPFIDCPPPIVADGTVMVPMRAIFTFMSCSVRFWPETNAIEVHAYDGKAILLWLGNKQARVDGRLMTLQAAPRAVGDTTYVPLRFIATAMGATVGWSEATKTATVCYCRRKGTLTLEQRGISAIYCG